MAGTISFGGIGSGLDTEGIVTGLLQASSSGVNALKTKATQTKAAVTTLSDVSTLLAKLKTQVSGLKEGRDVASYTVSASDTGIAATANGLALPGSFEVRVEKLAKAHRSYSTAQPLTATPLGQDGTLKFAIGTTNKTIDIDPTDTLENITSKINSLGMRVNASILNTGSERRLQIRGLDTGAENLLTMTETGTTLGLDTASALEENKIQTAQDSKIHIDGHVITRSNNQVQGAIQGVTLALKKESADPITVDVSADSSQIKGKLQGVVDAYNAIVTKLHSAAGFGTQKASNAALAGDQTLRGITNRLSSAMLTPITGAGTFNSPGSIGLNFNRDGTIKLDELKLASALEKDPASVTKVLAGTDTTSGVMDLLSDLVTQVGERGKGAVAVRQQSLEARAKQLDEQASREQARLDKYGDALRKQFTAMDGSVAASNNLMNYIGRF
jgi:flagellar hook-associated protein 2